MMANACTAVDQWEYREVRYAPKERFRNTSKLAPDPRRRSAKDLSIIRCGILWHIQRCVMHTRTDRLQIRGTERIVLEVEFRI
jgi:hypothetical protein